MTFLTVYKPGKQAGRGKRPTLKPPSNGGLGGDQRTPRGASLLTPLMTADFAAAILTEKH